MNRSSARSAIPGVLLLLAGCYVSMAATTQAADPPPAAPPAAPAGAVNTAKFTVSDSARENAKTAVAEAARILEAKEYKLFVETFMPPEKFKELSDGGKLDGLLKEIEKDAAEVAKVLRACKDIEPKLEGADKAMFAFEKPVDRGAGKPPIPEIPLMKIGKYWYLGD